MNNPTYEDILAYGAVIKEKYPSITKENLSTALQVKFIGVKDIRSILPISSAGFIANPFYPTFIIFQLLSMAFYSFKKVIIWDKAKLLKIQNKINQTVLYLVASTTMVN